jgi:broad specificity phosphatase PhoE
MRIYLIRHGETESNLAGVLSGQQDVALTAKGKQQAKALRPRLAALTPDLLLASDLSRAFETLALATGSYEITRCARLRERAFGVFEGRPLSEYLDHFEASGLLRSEYAPPEGESYADMVSRIEYVWQTHLSRVRGSVVVAAHGALNRVFIKWCLGTWQTDESDISQHNACLNVLEGDMPGSFVAERINCTQHLAQF